MILPVPSSTLPRCSRKTVRLRACLQPCASPRETKEEMNKIIIFFVKKIKFQIVKLYNWTIEGCLF
jgi:hypothetical protein